ncbi:MAG: DUF115 domain-containing protein, partial [Spirochaetaceae bacterium]|nr:DUF115 domain-containing protein [Spirochaetaceae bacterium]
EVSSADAVWYPDDPVALEDFLENALGDDAVSGVRALEWEPAARAFPEESRACAASVRAVLDRQASSAATLKTFGRRWIANACRSFLLAGKAVDLRRAASAVVVAAAGPSLNRSLAALEPYRETIALIAVSSALKACLDAGFKPDIVVTTDGGYWSRSHLYPLTGTSIVLAAPLTALPSARLWPSSTLLLLDQGSFAERELLPLLGPALLLPPHGTVAGTALRLASRLFEGPIIVAGLDLACRGDAEHASPHAFEALLEKDSRRLDPAEGRIWSRAVSVAPDSLGGGWRGSRSMGTYAATIALDLRGKGERPYRLCPSPVEIAGFASLRPEDLRGLLGEMAQAARGTTPLGKALELPAPSLRASLLDEKLGSWKELACRGAARLEKGEDVGDRDIEDLLRSVDLPDFAAARRAAFRGEDPGPSARNLSAAVLAFLSDLRERMQA